MGNNILPISVLIPSMNRPESLERTLTTYFQSNYVPNEVVVVDQSQKIEIQNLYKSIVEKFQKYANIKYVYQEEPSSAVARNTATCNATNDILIYSDDDVDVYNETLEQCYKVMNKDDVALVAGIDDNTKSANMLTGYIVGSKSFFKRKIGHVTKAVLGRYPNRVKGEVETQWAMGYFFAVKKSLVEKWCILWDNNLKGYAYGEDWDFSYNYYKAAKSENLKCVLSENVRVKHMVSTEYRVPSRQSIYATVINRRYLGYKHNMGVMSIVAQNWFNFWVLVRRFLSGDNYKDYLAAMRIVKKNKQSIKNGNITLFK